MTRLSFHGVWLVLVATLALGCYRPEHKDCETQCGPNNSCPTGFTCSAGMCTSGRSCAVDAAAVPSDTADADAVPDGDAGQQADADANEAGRPDLVTPHDSNDASDADDASHISDASDASDADGGGDASDASDASETDDANDAGDTPQEPDARIDGPDGPDAPGPDGKEVAPPWTPGVIPGLVLWLEADRGIEAAPGERVTEWLDQSPLHNDARQETEERGPKFLGASPLNGKPALEFTNKKWLKINDDVSLRWGVLDFLLLVVFRSPGCEKTDCILQQLYRKQEVDAPWIGPSLGLQPSGQIEVHLSHWAANHWLASNAGGYDSGRVHLVGAERRSAWPSVRIDGADFPSALPTEVVNLDAVGQHVYIGAHGINPDHPIDFPFNGHIGAVIAVKGPILAADLAQLESYLMTKYGAVPGGPP